MRWLDGITDSMAFRVWLSLVGTTQTLQTVVATVHVTIQAVGYLGLSAPSVIPISHLIPSLTPCPSATTSLNSTHLNLPLPSLKVQAISYVSEPS